MSEEYWFARPPERSTRRVPPELFDWDRQMVSGLPHFTVEQLTAPRERPPLFWRTLWSILTTGVL